MTGRMDAANQERTLYSRSDLPLLKEKDRGQVLAILGSFDGRGMDDDAFAWRALGLLDSRRVPRLAEALSTHDLPRALAAVAAACSGADRSRPRAPLTDPVLQAADEALANCFTFYGEKHSLPERIDWDFNPGTAHWGHDLNRFAFLAPLLAAYEASADARYARKAAGLMLDWIAACDFGVAFKGSPYAFGSYLNLAIHIGAWADAARRLAATGRLTPLELLRILASLQEHLAYLEIVTNGHAGNWPTIGCMGMLRALENLPVLCETDRFAAYCRRTLAAQIAEQVLPDGVQDELTPHYHQVVINNLLSARRSLQSLGLDLAGDTLTTLRKMVRYRQQTLMPDGSREACFNDGDPSAVPDLARQLSGAGLVGFAVPPEALGPEVFPYAGVAFLRQRADQGDLYLAFDAGPFGRAHQHEDKLGFWLFAHGRSFIVDPGRHLYDRSAASYLQHLKSTRAHSTILVDGQGQHSAGRRETWIARAPLDLGWRDAADEVRARGAYDLGYGPDNAIRVVHRREIVFVRQRCWVVFDSVEGEGEHLVESRFQFAPGRLVLDGSRARTAFDDANLLVWPEATIPFEDAHVEEGQENPRGGWYSDGYNRIEPAPALCLSVRGALPVRLATLLFPYKGGALPPLEFAFDGRTARVGLPDLGPVPVVCTLPGD